MKNQPSESGAVLPISAEFRGAELGDARRNQRLETVANSAARQPEASFPEQAGTEAGLEGTYRFLSNKQVRFERVLAPHVRRSVARGCAQGTFLAVHDTTEFRFKGETNREGLSRLLADGQGFFGHFCIGVGLDGRPLGTLGVETIVRSKERKGRRSPAKSRNAPDNEQLRWNRLAAKVDQEVGDSARVVHVMDREADDYKLFAAIVGRESGFVVRLFRDRTLAGGDRTNDSSTEASSKLFEAMESLPVQVRRRHFDVSARPAKGSKQNRKIHPPRKARTATVEIRAGAVELNRAGGSDPALPKSLRLNAVLVRETEPPTGEAPVLWRLLTTESVDTPEQVERVIDIYRKRWTIEEFFKALKTGCGYEKRQLESLHALLNALAVFTAVAWRLLLLRWLDRNAGDRPADEALSPGQTEALRAVAPHYRLKLPPRLTVHDALMAIARIGGHIRNNGPPGWIVLGRGFDSLLLIELGFLAAQEKQALSPAQRDPTEAGDPGGQM